MSITATDIQQALQAALKEAKNNTELLEKTAIYNPWFTPTQSLKALESWEISMNQYREWLAKESIENQILFSEKTVGVITAGNLPLVGLHDIICVLITGHRAKIKPSSQDNILLKFIVTTLLSHLPELNSRIEFTDGFIKDADAYIGTGSNNSARYFAYYFNQKPHIIRKNRNSVAIVTNETTTTEFGLLGEDIFTFFGMGCRNVTHLFVPKSFNFTPLFESWQHLNDMINPHKYANIYTYHKAILLMNWDKHMDNGFILLKENEAIHAPVSMLNFSYYAEIDGLLKELEAKTQEIQCIVGPANIVKTAENIIPFGQSQKPALWDYADNINTISFLKQLV